MQVERYEKHDIDLLFERQVESHLIDQHIREQPYDTYEPAVYDCREFGLCHVRWSVQTGKWIVDWFRKRPHSKPRVVVTVSVFDGVWKNFRRRWQFAMSKLGFLYPVAYEQQRMEGKLWVTETYYQSWRKNKDRSDLRGAIPDDAICREAERLYKRKKKKK